VISIYSYLEKRFNSTTRKLLSGVFQFSRAFAAGITVYAVAIVLEAVFQIPLWVNIVITGVIAIIYDYMGGIKAVILSDVIQMGILFLGFIVCCYYALDLLGGWENFTANLDQERLTAVDFSNLGVGSGQEFGFWPMVLGGFFLYASYYGCDQSQAQRILSSMNMKDVRKALLFNGFCRFPTVLLYCVMGLLIGTLVMTTPSFQSQIPDGQSDYMVPVFIVEYLPNGLIGLLIAAIMAAAMSSLDSALNSLSAATVQDFVLPSKDMEEMTDAKQLALSKKYTLVWGVICVILAFAAGSIAPTIIEAINKVGSLFYGPILATFLLGLLTIRVTGMAVNIGIVAGVLFNFILWIFFEDVVFWFWWNATGFVVTTAVALLVTYGGSDDREADSIVSPDQIEPRWKETSILVAYFAIIVLVSISMAWFF
jgi:SSS family transporter